MQMGTGIQIGHPDTRLRGCGTVAGSYFRERSGPAAYRAGSPQRGRPAILALQALGGGAAQLALRDLSDPAPLPAAGSPLAAGGCPSSGNTSRPLPRAPRPPRAARAARGPRTAGRLPPCPRSRPRPPPPAVPPGRRPTRSAAACQEMTPPPRSSTAPDDEQGLPNGIWRRLRVSYILLDCFADPPQNGSGTGAVSISPLCGCCEKPGVLRSSRVHPRPKGRPACPASLSVACCCGSLGEMA